MAMGYIVGGQRLVSIISKYSRLVKRRRVVFRFPQSRSCSISGDKGWY